MEAILTEILTILVAQWRWDIEQMSQPWMYYWLLIPISVFIVFFLVKWAVLTAPLWLPIYLIVSIFKKEKDE